MLQREVVARMTAPPATPDYGRLSVMLQARFRVTRLFVVPPGAFVPAPKIDSAVVRMVPLREAKPAIVDEALFARAVAAAFGQRRKTMRNALSGLCGTEALTAAGIDPARTRRARSARRSQRRGVHGGWRSPQFRWRLANTDALAVPHHGSARRLLPHRDPAAARGDRSARSSAVTSRPAPA